MTITRRGLLGSASVATAVTALPARSRAQGKPVITIGVINDQSGPYRDLNGPTSVIWDGWKTQYKLPAKLFERDPG